MSKDLVSLKQRSSFIESFVDALPTLDVYGDSYRIVSARPLEGVPMSVAQLSFVNDEHEFVYLIPRDNFVCYLLTFFTNFSWHIEYSRKDKSYKIVPYV